MRTSLAPPPPQEFHEPGSPFPPPLYPPAHVPVQLPVPPTLICNTCPGVTASVPVTIAPLPPAAPPPPFAPAAVIVMLVTQGGTVHD